MQLANYKKSYEEDDLVSMQRVFHIDYEKKKEDRKQYVEEKKSFLAKENPENDILPPEDKKEPLDAKIERLTANNTTSDAKSNKQNSTNKKELSQFRIVLSVNFFVIMLLIPDIQTINRCAQCFDGGFDNVFVQANTPYSFVVLSDDYIRHRLGGRTSGQRVFCIVGQFIGEA